MGNSKSFRRDSSNNGRGRVISVEGFQNSLGVMRRRLRKISLPDIDLSMSYLSFRRSSSGSNRCALHKPICKFSRRRREESTFEDVSRVAKTVWPVTTCESVFFPEFKVWNSSDQKKYKVLEEIGFGAYSKVYKVCTVDSGEEYAMKIIPKAKIIAEDAVDQMKEEVIIQSACGHNPFIANCIPFWQDKHFLFVVSEYISGGELWSLLRHYNFLSEELTRIYIAELALALDFLHNAGVIYRDMKLENIVLDESGHIRLVDFGLSKRVKYGARTSTLCGTLQFIAPEVYEHNYNHAADWWSLGVVACLLLTGQYPSIVQKRMAQMETNDENSTNHTHEYITIPEEDYVSTAARDMIGRLLQPNPQQRLRSLYTLKTIAFYKGFSFEDTAAKKFKPNDLISKMKRRPMIIDEDKFKDFDMSNGFT